MKRFFSLLWCFLLCLGCSPPSPYKCKILVTIPPYASFVKALMEDSSEVAVLVPDGANPHTYEPTPDQIKHFMQAKVWFRTGDPMEKKIIPLLQERHVEMIDLSKNWDALSLPEPPSKHRHEGPSSEEKDLHFWMNPLIVEGQVQEITQVLSKHFPEKATSIQERCHVLQAKLQKLDEETERKLAPFRGGYLLVSHPAFGYYCKRYGFHQLSIEVEGKDPLPQDIAHLMHEIKSHSVPVILVEPQYNKKGAVILADKLQITYEEIDPYVEDYFKMFRHLTDVIVRYYDHSN